MLSALNLACGHGKSLLHVEGGWTANMFASRHAVFFFLLFSWCVSLCRVVVQWVDVLALSGDSADNIPGVKGIGIKTAPNLVRAHGDIEGVLAAAPVEKKKVGVKLCLCPVPPLDLCCRSSWMSRPFLVH